MGASVVCIRDRRVRAGLRSWAEKLTAGVSSVTAKSALQFLRRIFNPATYVGESLSRHLGGISMGENICR
jgi:hypothetical protein